MSHAPQVKARYVCPKYRPQSDMGGGGVGCAAYIWSDCTAARKRGKREKGNMRVTKHMARPIYLQPVGGTRVA